MTASVPTDPHTEPVPTPPHLPGRDELAALAQQAWFRSSDNHYPHGRGWYAVADAVLASVNAPTADVANVDEEVRLIALCLDLFQGVDPETVSRVCRYVVGRLSPSPYPQAF